MTEFLLILFDLIGTVAFAISGALVGVGKKMDLFGTIVLAVSTACGGGVIRDMVVGNIPPNMFRNPLYVSIAAVVAVIVFFLCYWHRKMPKWAARCTTGCFSGRYPGPGGLYGGRHYGGHLLRL